MLGSVCRFKRAINSSFPAKVSALANVNKSYFIPTGVDDDYLPSFQNREKENYIIFLFKALIDKDISSTIRKIDPVCIAFRNIRKRLYLKYCAG